MLSSINAARPYSVNNYSSMQNSAKSQPSFGSASSEVAKESTGFFRKAGRFLNNAKFNLLSNAAFITLGATSHDSKIGIIGGQIVADFTDVLCFAMHQFDHKSVTGRFDNTIRMSASHYPLNPIAWIADGVRAIGKSLKE